MADERGTRPDGKRAGPVRVASAVFWSFFGVRKSKDHNADALTLTPAQVIVAGIVGAALFVGCLIVVVHFVTR